MSQYARLIARANATGLPYLLIGGHAVGAWGFFRATKDIDFLVSEKVVDDWKKWAVESGYDILHGNRSFIQFTPSKEEMPVLDVMIVDDATWQKLFSTSVEKDFAAEKVRVPSVENLLALKCHAIRYGSKKRLIKDFMDIVELVNICRIDVREEKFRDMVIKYAGQNTYDDILKYASEEK